MGLQDLCLTAEPVKILQDLVGGALKMVIPIFINLRREGFHILDRLVKLLSLLCQMHDAFFLFPDQELDAAERDFFLDLFLF